MFQISAEHIKRLAAINHFELPVSSMFFFGLRGCLPVCDDSTQFKNEHMVQTVSYDHIHPRCTLGQYKPGKGIALFPGSTIPHINYIRQSLASGGMGTNMLFTGYYHNYHKGWHNWGKKTSHHAFRQHGELPVRRTANDLEYNNDDRVDFTHPYDNLHAAWSMGTSHDFFSSAGCQVVVGYPSCKQRNDLPDTGPWKIFKENAYGIEQEDFDYMLLNGRDAEKVALSNGQRLMSRLRFGSKGEWVGKVQQELKRLHYYDSRITQKLDIATLRALLAFQSAYFGKDADDGIVGPITAAALAIDLPFV